MENKKIYFAVKAFIVHEGNFLVMHKTGVKEDLWELPGGRMEFGETAEDTIIREAYEEAGLAVTPLKVLDTWNCIFDDYQITGIIYQCTIKNSQVTLSDEHDNYKWVNANVNSTNPMYKVFREKMTKWNWAEIL